MTKLSKRLYNKIINELDSYNLDFQSMNPKRAIFLISLVNDIENRHSLFRIRLPYLNKENAKAHMKEIRDLYKQIQYLKVDYETIFKSIIDCLYPEQKGDTK